MLITHLSHLSGLFLKLADFLATINARTPYPLEAAAMLEVACNNIAKWPPLEATGPAIELHFLGKLLTVEVPLLGQPQALDVRSGNLASRDVVRLHLLIHAVLVPY